MDTQKMACPNCGTVNVMVGVIDQPRQYVCKQCGERYDTPDSCFGPGSKRDQTSGGGPRPDKKG